MRDLYEMYENGATLEEILCEAGLTDEEMEEIVNG